jgi:hypothetical protein
LGLELFVGSAWVTVALHFGATSGGLGALHYNIEGTAPRRRLGTVSQAIGSFGLAVEGLMQMAEDLAITPQAIRSFVELYAVAPRM